MRRETQPITVSAALETTLAKSAPDRLKQKARLTRHIDRVVKDYSLPDRQKSWLSVEETKDAEEVNEFVERWRSSVGNNVVLLDETTIGVVEELIQGSRPLTPLGLLDLSTFVNNYVLRDRVMRTGDLGTARINEPPWTSLWSERVPYVKGLSDAVRQSTLTWLDSLRKGRNADQGMRVAVADGWKLLVGSSAPAASKQFGELSWFSKTTVEELIERIYHNRITKGDLSVRHIAIAQSNQRAVFNMELSRLLQIPYAGSICRLPVRKYLWEQGRWADALVSSIPDADITAVTVLDDAYRKRVSGILPTRESAVAVPVLLAAVLQRIDRLNQFEEGLAELRDKAAPLRKRLSELESGLAGDNQSKEVTRLLAAFGDDVRVFRRTVSELTPLALTVAGIVLKAATGQPAWLTASLAALAAPDKISRRTFVRLWNRVVRRDLWFVTEIGAMSNAVLQSRSKLERLWRPEQGVGFGSEFAKRLERISELQYH